MTPDEHAEMTRLCEAMVTEHDLTKILGVVQQLNALLDRALIRKTAPLPVGDDPLNNVSQRLDRTLEPES